MKTYVPDRSDTRGFKPSPKVKPVTIAKSISWRSSAFGWLTWERFILGTLLFILLSLNGILLSQYRAAQLTIGLLNQSMQEQRKVRDQLYRDITVLREELENAQSNKSQSDAAHDESQRKLDETAKELNQAEKELKRKSEERNVLSAQHLQSLLDTAGVVSGDPLLAHSILSNAFNFAKVHQLETATAETLLAALPRKQQPQSSCHVEVVSVRKDSLGIVADISVTNTSSAPLEGLGRADFEVRSGERRVHMAAVGTAHFNDRQHETVVLLDMSGSTEGAPHDAAIQGASAFLSSISTDSKFRVYPFADDVFPVTPWSNDRELHRIAVERLTSGGGTALYKAIRVAMEDLLTRSGSRSIVVFTDGSDSFNTEDLAATLNKCKVHGIQIHVLALMTPEVKESVLRDIAEQTNGMYLSTPNPSHLVEQFAQVTKAFTRPVYRVAIFEPVNEKALTLQVGDLPPVTLKVADRTEPANSGS